MNIGIVLMWLFLFFGDEIIANISTSLAGLEMKVLSVRSGIKVIGSVCVVGMSASSFPAIVEKYSQNWSDINFASFTRSPSTSIRDILFLILCFARMLLILFHVSLMS